LEIGQKIGNWIKIWKLEKNGNWTKIENWKKNWKLDKNLEIGQKLENGKNLEIGQTISTIGIFSIGNFLVKNGLNYFKPWLINCLIGLDFSPYLRDFAPVPRVDLATYYSGRLNFPTSSEGWEKAETVLAGVPLAAPFY